MNESLTPINGSICFGTVTLNDKLELVLPSQRLYLDIIRDGIERNEIPGHLRLVLHYGASPYFSMEIDTDTPKDTEQVKQKQKRLKRAMARWNNQGMPNVSVKEFRTKYLTVTSSGRHRRRPHAFHL